VAKFGTSNQDRTISLEDCNALLKNNIYRFICNRLSTHQKWCQSSICLEMYMISPIRRCQVNYQRTIVMKLRYNNVLVVFTSARTSKGVIEGSNV
jgi:hypothetical protein